MSALFDYARLRRLARRRTPSMSTLLDYARLRRLARRMGFHIVRADFYSPIPDGWDAALWDQPTSLPGVDLGLDAGVELLTTLAPHIADYAPPEHPPGTRHGYHSDNGMYPEMDAEVLFAMLRHLRPRRVLEIGAGWSSRVVADAVEPAPPDDHRIVDPFPVDHLLSLGAYVEPLTAQQLPLEAFTALGPGDVLIIDTTHTVKPGSDVNRLVLEVLPALAPGVVVHIHDIFLPFTYPEFMHDAGAYWQEQWLVQAYLAFNPRVEVLLANYALSRLRPEGIEAAVPGLSSHVPGSALWLRVRE